MGSAKKSWVFRVDKPHANAEFHHVNINPKMTGVKDPHIQLPSGAASAGEAATTAANVFGKTAIVVALH